MKKLLSFLLAGLVSAPAVFSSVVAYSPPVAGMTISVPAASTRSISLPLLHASVGDGAMIGTITGVGANYIDASGANWTAGSLSTASNPYYVRILSGSAKGRVLLIVSSPANTATRVTLNNDSISLADAGGPVAGDTYEIVLADTLSSLFGSTMQGGADASTADNILLWTGGAWQTFYRNTTRNRWELKGVTFLDAGNTVLRTDRGMMVTRRAASAFTLFVTGRVRQEPFRLALGRPGSTFLSTGVLESSTGVPETSLIVTLSGLALQNSPGWVKGTTATNADTIQLWSGGSWQTFYYHTTNARWQLQGVGFLDAGGTAVANRPAMIRRLNAGSNSSENMVVFPLPYSI